MNYQQIGECCSRTNVYVSKNSNEIRLFKKNSILRIVITLGVTQRFINKSNYVTDKLYGAETLMRKVQIAQLPKNKRENSLIL